MTTETTEDGGPDGETGAMKAIFAETVHTAFRKGCENGNRVHREICAMPGKDWSDAIDWMVWALGQSGYDVVKREAGEPKPKVP